MEQKKMLLLLGVAAIAYYFLVYKKTGGVSRGQAVLNVVSDVAKKVVDPVEKVRVASQQDLMPRSVGMVPLDLMQSDPKALLGIQNDSGEKLNA